MSTHACTLPAQLQAFLNDLTRNEQYDEQAGYHFWDTPHPRFPDHPVTDTGTCTNGALLIARQFHGRVVGYLNQDNPTSLIAPNSGGHDFAIIGDLLVDWWAVHVSENSPHEILHLETDRALIDSLYGDREKWKEVTTYET